MNNKERRIQIASIVGTHERNPEAPLTKPTLNAILAYFTGEHSINPALIYTGLAPGRRDVCERVAVEVEERVPGSMGEWFDRLDYGDYDTIKFRSEELDSLLAALERADDLRKFSGEYETLEKVIDVD